MSIHNYIMPGAWMIIKATFYFSLMHVCVKLLSHLPSHQVVFFRAIISLGLCLIYFAQNKQSPWGHNRPLLILRGLAGALALVLYFHTLQVMPLASAVTIQKLSPLLTIILAYAILGEGSQGHQWRYAILAFLGVIMVKGFDSRVDIVDLIAGIGAALCSGLAYTCIRSLRKSDDAMVIVFYFPLVTLPLILPFVLHDWVTPQGADWLILLAVGVLTQLGQVNLTKAYQIEKAANIVHFTYLGPLYALGFGFFLFDEHITLLAAAGMVLTISAVFLSTRETYRIEYSQATCKDTKQ